MSEYLYKYRNDDEPNYIELFNNISHFIEDNYNYHTIDIEYPADCDYIVYFHIKECKGWKFGIYWDRDGRLDTHCQFWGMYENEIDKFKFVRALYRYEMILRLSDFDKYDISPIIDIITYIHKHPIRAWYRDYYGVDFNRVYKNSLSILYENIKYHIWRFNKIHLTRMLDRNIVKYVITDILPLADYDDEHKAYLQYTPNSSPSYDILCYIDDPTECGCYEILEADSEKLIKWNKKINRAKKISDIFNFMWYSPIDNDVVYLLKEEGEN